ncbi:MAG: hypothetical protein AAFR73_05915 [Pseudomonadota bacterium]
MKNIERHLGNNGGGFERGRFKQPQRLQIEALNCAVIVTIQLSNPRMRALKGAKQSIKQCCLAVGQMPRNTPATAVLQVKSQRKRANDQSFDKINLLSQ